MAQIRTSSTAEYFAKNLQQVGFSSPIKAVLTTVKEAVDNSLDACEEAGILPSLKVIIKKEGVGSSRNSDLISIVVEDNGPGLEEKHLAKVFGEYLASSKFGQGRCSRGQQGIGISAATTWAQLTNAKGVKVITKTKKMTKALSVLVNMDIKNNKGVVKDKKEISIDKDHGLRVEFLIDGRVQLKGEGGLLTYLEGTILVNPHLEIEYDLIGQMARKVLRVTDIVPEIPPSTLPHPHTMKLGEFLHHANLYGESTLKKFFQTGFSRINQTVFNDLKKLGIKNTLFNKKLKAVNQQEYKDIFQALQQVSLPNPSTRSVLIVGEEGLTESIHRLGDIDFFSVITRKPKICDYKSVVVEVAIARLKSKSQEGESYIQLLRFANRVPLQFDKASCAITKAVESVNWRSYGLVQSRKALPVGPYVFAISVTSPFIKFKNASKETIDASEELVDEIRLTLMQAGQKLNKHIRKELHTEDLLRKKEYIKKFAPILIKKLKDVTKVSEKEMALAEAGLNKILSKGAEAAERALVEAEKKLDQLNSQKIRRKNFTSQAFESSESDSPAKTTDEIQEESNLKEDVKNLASKKSASKKSKTSKASSEIQETFNLKEEANKSVAKKLKISKKAKKIHKVSNLKQDVKKSKTSKKSKTTKKKR